VADLSGTLPTYTSVESTSGDVEVTGAAGQLDFAVASGGCTLQAAGWSTSNGTVTLTTGNLVFHVGSGLSGRIDARAGDVQSGELVGPDPLPTGWTEEEVAANQRRYAFGPDAAQMGTVTLRTEASASRIDLAQE
jgi:hypothetical protein